MMNLLFLSESTFSVASLLPIVIILTIGAITTLVLHKLNVKFMSISVIFLVIGIVCGTWFNKNEIFTNGLSTGLYTISLVFVLFLSGMETDFSVIKDNLRSDGVNIHPLTRSFIYLIISIFLSFGLSFIFVKYINVDKVLGIILLTICFSSTFASFVNPIVHEHGDSHTTIGKIISTYATMSELLSIISLSIILIIHSATDATVFIHLAILIALLVVMYFIIKYIPATKLYEEKNNTSDVLLTLAVIAVLGVTILSEMMEAEIILGAFLAGMIFKLGKVSHQTEQSLNSLGQSFFAPVFYFLAGVQCSFKVFIDNPMYLLLLVGIFGVYILAKSAYLSLFKYYKASTVIPSMLLASSTIIVPISMGHLHIFDHEFVQVLVMAAALTCIVPPIIFKANNQYNTVREEYKDVILELGEEEPNKEVKHAN